MCNLSQGIKEKATENTLIEVIMNMHKKGYSSEQIAEIVEKSVREVEAIIEKKELILA